MFVCVSAFRVAFDKNSIRAITAKDRAAGKSVTFISHHIK